MDWLEIALLNSSGRRWLQQCYEAPIMLRLGGQLTGARVLEVGCGGGFGVELALTRFGAAQVDAVDINPRQVAKARRRLDGRAPADRQRVLVGDVTRLFAPDARYDAVLDYGALHHIQDWRRALAEIRRVLRDNGRFLFEEIAAPGPPGPPGAAHTHRWPGLGLGHRGDGRFDATQFQDELRRHGFAVSAMESRIHGRVFFGLATADPAAVGQREPPPVPAADG